MFRTTLTLIAILLASIFGSNVTAQTQQGRWTVHPTVGDRFSEVIETPGRVYALSGGTLVHQNFSDNEFHIYDAGRLSDSSRIRHIRYNYSKGYLLIVYESNNMDLLYDDGTIVNLPEIRDASVSASRTVNGSSFGDGTIYLATDFGLVVYDDVRHEVIESGIYNRKLTHAFVLGDHLLVRTSVPDGPFNLFAALVGGRHNEWSVFRKLDVLDFGSGMTEVVPLSDGTLLHNRAGTGVMRHKYDFDRYEASDVLFTDIPAGSYCDIHPTADGAVFHYGDRMFFTDGGNTEEIVLPVDADACFAPARSTSSVWLVDGKTATRYNLSGSAPTVLMSVAVPDGFTVPEPCQMMQSRDGKWLYVANISANFVYQEPGDNFDLASYVDRVGADGKITDVACLHADKVVSSDYVSFCDRYDRSTGRIVGACRFVPDPDDPDLYFMADNHYGLVAIKDNEIVEIFDSRNSYTRNAASTRTLYAGIDNDGNLWMGTGYIGEPSLPEMASFAVLPAARRRGNLKEVTKADWIPVPEFTDESLSREVKCHFFRKYPEYSVFFDGSSNGALTFRNNNGTPLNFNDDRLITHSSFIDREGNPFETWYFNSMKEDADGRLWLGTSFGVIVIDDVREVFNADFRVRRPIVARDDGTGLGDYLLDGEVVYDIAVDPSNRKWIATQTSGVYLVNPAGSKILAHYTSSNSPLPSDIVESVAADPNSNRVWFGTTQGVVCYESDSAPAADDYSDVYAYPNPVRPEYNGWITITGLMENSLVKIADAAGNVFFQGTSEGGMISWDGCGRDGQRVRSGIYFVFASQNGSGGSSGAVTKIMVVN